MREMPSTIGTVPKNADESSAPPWNTVANRTIADTACASPVS
jgi:hypothetical protein